MALHRGDVSIVTMGANPATSSVLTARSAAAATDAVERIRKTIDYTTGARAWLDGELLSAGLPLTRSRPHARRSTLSAERIWLENEMRKAGR